MSNIPSRTACSLLLIGLFAPEAQGQGFLLFDTAIPNVVNAMVVVDGPVFTGPLGEGFSAQVYKLGGGSEVPLLPATTFRTAIDERGYVVPTIVEVPNSAPGNSVTVVFKVFPSGYNSYESSPPNQRGQSSPINTLLGTQQSPGLLTGLQGFTYTYVPEPTPSVLIGMAGLAFFFFRQRPPNSHNMIPSARNSPHSLPSTLEEHSAIESNLDVP